MSHYFTTPITLTRQGKGRPKGSLNKTHSTIRWSLIEAFRLNGGVDALAAWGKANPDLFFPMLTKLLPTELAESGAGQDNRIQVVILPATSSAGTTSQLEISSGKPLDEEGGGLLSQPGVAEREPDA